MTILVIASVSLGMIFGMLFSENYIVQNLEFLSQATLSILLLSIGLDIGSNKSALSNIKDKFCSIIIVTLSVVFGSLFGGAITAWIFNMKLNEGLAISAGFGWYSLSGVILTNMGNAELGSIAFLSNIFRELITFIIVPVVAIKTNYLSAIGPAGATSMDTTLPIISSNTDSNTTIVAFASGVLLSALVPILVPLLYTII